MAVNRFHVEAWSLPLATTTKTVASVPFISGQYQDEISQVGRGSLVVRADWDRLNDVVDPDNGVASLFRIFQDGTLIGSFFGRRLAKNLTDDTHGLVTITGPSAADVLNYARVANYDYPAQPTVDPDWTWGAGADVNAFRNGSFEDSEEVQGIGLSDMGTDFEDQSLQGWASIPEGGGFDGNDIGPTVDSGDAQAGTYSLTWDPDQYHSGVRKKVRVVGGESYTWQLYLKSATTGKRFTAGFQLPAGASATHTNAFVYGGYALAELGNVASNGLGTPGGSTDGTWQLIQLAGTFPTFSDDEDLDFKDIWLIAQYDHHGGGDGPVARIDSMTATGPGLGLLPWKRKGSSTTVTTFEQDATPGSTSPRDGTVACAVVTTDTTKGIKQKVEGLTVGRTYSFYAYVHHTTGSAQDFRVRIRRGSGDGVIATSGAVSVPTGGGWTELAATGLVDQPDVIVDIVKDTAGTFWVDDCRFREGLQAASWTDIVGQLLDDAAVDHTGEAGVLARDVLGFLDYTSFSATLDSNGDAVSPALVEYRAKRGKKYGRVMAEGSRFGAEWRIVDSVTTGLSLEIYNPYDWATRTGGIGSNLVGTGVPELRYGTGITGGPLVKTPATANRVTVEGEAGLWDVKEDATAVGNYDTREAYEGDRNLLGDTTLSGIATQLLDESTVPVTSIKVNIDPGDDPDIPTPGVHFNVGDTYPLDLAGDFTGSKRCVKVTTDFTSGTGRYTVEWDNTSYTSDPLKGVTEAVRLLLEKVEELDKPEDKSAPSAATEPVDTGGKLETTYLVASVVASDEVKAVADYICDGVDDQEEINLAFNSAYAQAVGPVRVQLSEGNFVITGQINPFNADNTLVGSGRRLTYLQIKGSASLASIILWYGGVMEDFTIFEDGTSTVTLSKGVIEIAGSQTDIQRVAVTAHTTGHAIYINAGRIGTSITDCLITGAGGSESGIYVGVNCTGVDIAGNRISSADKYGVYVEAPSTGFTRGVRVVGNLLENIGGAAASTYDGVHVADPTGTGATEGVMVLGNIVNGITTTPRDAVRLAGANISGSVIGGNVLISGSGTHETDSGTGTRVLATTTDAPSSHTHTHASTTGRTANDHHNEAHTVASHSDTTATGAELETLTDGSDASTLHTHTAAGTGGADTITDTNSTVNVTHGLGTTPTVVIVTPDGNEFLWVTAIGATTFTVNRSGTSGARGFTWLATT